METINDIVERSKELNQRNQISGALLATRTHFLQVIEGEFSPLNQTFFRIASDSRHDNLELVSYGQVEKRLFDGWVMKGFGIFDLNSDLEAVLKKKFGVEEGGVRLPTEEWAALSLMHDINLIHQ
jgi:hypothetical protein